MKDSKDQGSEEEIGPSWLTKFEKTRVLGIRALQIAMGAPPMIKVPKDVKDPLKIAEMELEAGVLPILIKRKIPGLGRKYVDVNELAKSGKRRWVRLAEKISKI